MIELRKTLLRNAFLLAGPFGALIAAYYALTFPILPGTSRPFAVLANLAQFAVAVAFFLWVSRWRLQRLLARELAWVEAGAPPDDGDVARAVALPRRMALEAFAGLLVFAFGTSLANLMANRLPSQAVGVLVGLTLTFAAMAALIHLVAERTLRPVYALALADRAPRRTGTVGIGARLVLAWVTGSGIPLLFLIAIPVSRQRHGALPITVSLEYMAVLGLLSGLGATILVARSVAEPLDGVRAALGRVEAGDLETGLQVDDAGEIGLLQSGFNRMVAGLRERQRLQDLFGRHVGEEVARNALARGVALGGEQRDVTALFVDLVNSTALTEHRSAAQVVEVLNGFFAAVVETISAEGGWVNKFEGDGALCVFGAPDDQPDHAARALRAARCLRDRLVALDLVAGIGVSSGGAVAGNVGAEARYEYTVIGRPVHEAARVCDLAKQRPGHLLATAASVEAGPTAEGWLPAGAVELRGFAEATTVYEA